MASAIAPLAVGFLANKVVSQVTGDNKLGAIAGLAAGGLTGMGGLTGGASGILGGSAGGAAAPAFGGTAATAAGASAGGNALTNWIGNQFPLSDFGASAAGSAIKSTVAPNLSSAMFGGAGSPHAGMSAATPMNPAEFMGLGGQQVPPMQGFNTNINSALSYGSPNPQAGIPVQSGLTAGNVMPNDMFQTGFGEAGRAGFTGAQNQATNPYLFQDTTPASMFDMGEPQLTFPTNSPISSMSPNTANVSIPQSMGNSMTPPPSQAAPVQTQTWDPLDYAPDDMMTYGSDMSQPAAQAPKMDGRYNANPNTRPPEAISNPTGPVTNEAPIQVDPYGGMNYDDASAGLYGEDPSQFGVTDRSFASLDGPTVASNAVQRSPMDFQYSPDAVDAQVMGTPSAAVQAPSEAAALGTYYSPASVDSQVMGPSASATMPEAASNIQRSYNMFGDDVSAGAAADTDLLAQSSEAAQAVAGQLSDSENISNSMKAFGKKALDWLNENPNMVQFLGALALQLLAKKKQAEKVGGGGGGVQFGPMASAYAGTSGGGGGQAPLGFGLAQRKGYTPQAI